VDKAALRSVAIELTEGGVLVSVDQPLGAWFFDPACTVKRRFKLGDEFSVVYVKAPPPAG